VVTSSSISVTKLHFGNFFRQALAFGGRPEDDQVGQPVGEHPPGRRRPPQGTRRAGK